MHIGAAVQSRDTDGDAPGTRPGAAGLAFTLLTRSASALHHAQRPKVLLVDCHDSYTHNVASWLHDAGATPEVVAADDAAFEEQHDKDAAALLRKYDAVGIIAGAGPPGPRACDIAPVPATRGRHAGPRRLPRAPVPRTGEGGSVKRLQEPQHGLVSRVAHSLDFQISLKGMEQGLQRRATTL